MLWFIILHIWIFILVVVYRIKHWIFRLFSQKTVFSSTQNKVAPIALKLHKNPILDFHPALPSTTPLFQFVFLHLIYIYAKKPKYSCLWHLKLTPLSHFLSPIFLLLSILLQTFINQQNRLFWIFFSFFFLPWTEKAVLLQPQTTGLGLVLRGVLRSSLTVWGQHAGHGSGRVKRRAEGRGRPLGGSRQEKKRLEQQ